MTPQFLGDPTLCKRIPAKRQTITARKIGLITAPGKNNYPGGRNEGGRIKRGTDLPGLHPEGQPMSSKGPLHIPFLPAQHLVLGGLVLLDELAAGLGVVVPQLHVGVGLDLERGVACVV